MKKKVLLVPIFVLTSSVLFAQVDENKYYRTPSQMVSAIYDVYTEAVVPRSDCAVLAFDWVNVFWELNFMDEYWGVYLIFENKTDEELYVNFREATAAVDSTSYRLFYKLDPWDRVLSSYAINVLPNLRSRGLYVRPDSRLWYKNLEYTAKHSGVESEQNKKYVIFNIPVIKKNSMETQTYSIEFEVKGVTKKYMRQNDYFRSEKWGEYFPRAAYEALQNRPIPETSE